MNYKVASVVALVLLVGCLWWMVVAHSLFANGPVSIAIQGAAAGLMLWARMTFGMRSLHAVADPTSGGIVKTGPYRFVRHPIYAAIFYFFVGAVVAHPGMRSVAASAIAACMLFVRMRSEEILLVEHYPEYAVYAAQTARILPGVF